MFGDEITEDRVDWNKGYIQVDGQKIQGIIHLSILCQQNELYPFLPIRNNGKRSICANCFTCGKKSLKSYSVNKCKHSLIQRAIVGNYTIEEINYALSLGYKIIKIFEIMYYTEKTKLFEDFIKLLAFRKIKSSKLFEEDDSDQIKLQKCNIINQKMQFTEGFKLQPENVKDDPNSRNFAKLALNSFLGKFSQRSDKSFNVIVSSLKEIEKYFHSKTFAIKDLFAINSHYCQIEVEYKRKTLVKPSKKTNVVIGSHVTAFARIFLHQSLKKLLQNGIKVFMTDTDNFIISKRIDQDLPFEISQSFGDFHYELPLNAEIESFFSLGPKNYSISYKIDGKLFKIVKLRGVSLRNICNDSSIDTKLYEDYLNSALNRKPQKKLIPQVRLRTSKFNKTSKLKFEKVFFRNSILSKRIINPKCKNLSSFPFGFVDNL